MARVRVKACWGIVCLCMSRWWVQLIPTQFLNSSTKDFPVRFLPLLCSPRPALAEHFETPKKVDLETVDEWLWRMLDEHSNQRFEAIQQGYYSMGKVVHGRMTWFWDIFGLYWMYLNVIIFKDTEWQDHVQYLQILTICSANLSRYSAFSFVRTVTA